MSGDRAPSSTRGLHHRALISSNIERTISVAPDRWEHLRAKLAAAGGETQHMSGSSLSFSGPDGERLELIKDHLREMYGTTVA